MILLAALLACTDAPRPCTDGAANLVEGADPLACEDAFVVEDAIERLAGRPLPANERDALYREVARSFTSDPAAARTRLDDAREAVAVLDQLAGIDGARQRGQMVYGTLHGDGVLAGWPTNVRTAAATAVSEWARSEEERVVLGESDIEGFLRYASLCREVQAGGALRLSIADRPPLYGALVKRFTEGSTDDRTAILAIGSAYWAAKGAWSAAPYAQQQEFAAGAPLPPPMTATSLDYALAIIGGDLPLHAANLHATLGPLRIVPARNDE